MSKLEQIETLLGDWGAAVDYYSKNGHSASARRVGHKIQGLKAAIAILKEPPNQVNAPDSLKPGLLEGVAYSIEYVDAETVVFTRRR